MSSINPNLQSPWSRKAKDLFGALALAITLVYVAVNQAAKRIFCRRANF